MEFCHCIFGTQFQLAGETLDTSWNHFQSCGGRDLQEGWKCSVLCCVGRSQVSSLGRDFSPPGLGADYKNCVVPQFPHQRVTSKAERQL